MTGRHILLILRGHIFYNDIMQTPDRFSVRQHDAGARHVHVNFNRFGVADDQSRESHLRDVSARVLDAHVENGIRAGVGEIDDRELVRIEEDAVSKIAFFCRLYE